MDQPPALGGRHAAPGPVRSNAARAVLTARSMSSARAARHRREHVAGRRVVGLEGLAGRGLHPVSADEHAVVAGDEVAGVLVDLGVERHGLSSGFGQLARRYAARGLQLRCVRRTTGGGLMNSWVAIPSTGDRRGRALRLARAHDAVLSGAPPPPELRGVIADSWRRCTAAGFDAQRGLAPIALAGDEASERWARSPLAAAEGVLRELLDDVRAEGEQVLLVCDADGTLLWIDGDERMLHDATGVHLMRGARWSEADAGHQRDGHRARGRPLLAGVQRRALRDAGPRLDLQRGAAARSGQRRAARRPGPLRAAADRAPALARAGDRGRADGRGGAAARGGGARGAGGRAGADLRAGAAAARRGARCRAARARSRSRRGRPRRPDRHALAAPQRVDGLARAASGGHDGRGGRDRHARRLRQAGDRARRAVAAAARSSGGGCWPSPTGWTRPRAPTSSSPASSPAPARCTPRSTPIPARCCHAPSCRWSSRRARASTTACAPRSCAPATPTSCTAGSTPPPAATTSRPAVSSSRRWPRTTTAAPRRCRTCANWS